MILLPNETTQILSPKGKGPFTLREGEKIKTYEVKLSFFCFFILHSDSMQLNNLDT